MFGVTRSILIACCATAFGITLSAQNAENTLNRITVLVDQVGYETNAPKLAIIRGSSSNHPTEFSLQDEVSNKTVLTGALSSAGKVAHWSGTYWIADFSGWKQTGHYALRIRSEAGEVTSCAFVIDDNLLERSTLSDVIYYFKGQRSTGLIDRADSHLKLPPGQTGFVDAHGGWYDATGDYGIHLSHQNPTSYFNPQQMPLVAWTLLKSYESLVVRKDDNFSEYERRILDEGLFGADYLTRIKRPGGSFYESITAPGREKLAQDRAIGNPNWRTQIKKNDTDSTEVGSANRPHSYEASFRAGGGMSIAALALAGTMPIDGDIPRATYLRTAEEAFAFLDAHNRELLNDGNENILDDYCALLAATELYRATHKDAYRTAAKRRAENLLQRLTTANGHRDYWRADDGIRPFFHPSDAGLPVVSLLEYATIAPEDDRVRVLEAVRRSLDSEMETTAEVNNPFGYARQLVRFGNGQVRTAFFFPHDTEAAPWWQGENARLASLASAARLAAPYFGGDPAFHARLEEYAWNQLHWILGRNPFDASMLGGSGHNQAPYMFFRSYKYANAPGAIVNGITSALNDPDGIAWNEGFAITGKDEDWRWSEEWLPHAAWYLYAISLPHE
ncbi:glycoside hydrolase family 9 protein [Edaphobacter bradus]|uniref:glycoside hydrolase family 9 protein n=1 Tax=Edaphobacter bradus TaxID=2259016 RepID=UPI0037BFF8B4